MTVPAWLALLITLKTAWADVTFVELPSPGTLYEGNAVFGVVESVKAASDLYMPITGEVLEVNEALNDAPEQVNDDPYGDGWMIKIQPSSPPPFTPVCSTPQVLRPEIAE